MGQLGRIPLMLLIVLVLAEVCLAQTTQNESNPLEESIKAQLEALELEEILDYANRIDPEFRDYVPGLSLQDFVGRNGLRGGVDELLALFIRTLISEIYVSSLLLRQLLVIAMLAGLLHQISVSFGQRGLVDLAFAVCFLVLVFIGLQSFRTALAVASTAIDEMVSFMYSILPLMATLLASVGGITSAAIFHPVLVAVVGSIAGLVRYVLFPLLYISVVIGLLAHFSPQLQISRLAAMARQVSTILLSSFFVIFSGVMVVRGAIAPVADGVGLRAAKFLTKTFVPVIGGMFADAAEVVIGGSLLIKNGVGIFGLIMIFFLAALPIIKVWAVILIYKLVGILAQPICDARLVEALGSLESSLTMILAAMATVALMFFLSITILIGFGNLAVIMR